MNIIKYFPFVIFSFFSTLLKADFNCNNSDRNVQSLVDISLSIKEKPVQEKTILFKDLNTEDILQTKENEYLIIELEKPFIAKYILYPESKIKINKLMNLTCGPQIELIGEGKIEIEGDHGKSSDCPSEIITHEIEVNPVGTEYSVDTRTAIANQLAELNGEYRSNKSNLVHLDQKVSVKKGEVIVKLRRISAVKKEKIKFVKIGKNKKKKQTLLALNKVKPIKLKKNSSFKLTNYKKLKNKKTRVAEVQVINPNDN